LESDEEISHVYEGLSNTLRKYLELQFQLPAPEQTTTEFLQTLQKSPLPAEQCTLLGDLLQHCDLVKFARLAPSRAECRSAIETARTFIERSNESTSLTGSPSQDG
jgi:hypothetical protein